MCFVAAPIVDVVIVVVCVGYVVSVVVIVVRSAAPLCRC